MSVISALGSLLGPSASSAASNTTASDGQRFSEALQQSIDAQTAQNLQGSPLAPPVEASQPPQASTQTSAAPGSTSTSSDTTSGTASGTTSPTRHTSHGAHRHGATAQSQSTQTDTSAAQAAAAAAAAALQAQAQNQGQAADAAAQDAQQSAADATLAGQAGSATDGSSAGASGESKSVRDALDAALHSLTGGQGAAGLRTNDMRGMPSTTGAAGSEKTADSFGSHLAAGKNATEADTDGKRIGAAEKTADGKAAGGDAAKASSDASGAATAAAQAATQDSTQNTAAQGNSSAATSDSLAAAQAQAAQQAAQAAQVQGAQASGAAASASASALSPSVGTSDWEDALSQKVVFLSNAHQQSAELTLNPKDLGPLQVVLQVSENHAHALFVSQHQQVREAVEAALPKLREAMEQNGIGLGSASVSDGFARQMNQQAQQDGGSGSGREKNSRDAGNGTTDDTQTVSAAATTQRSVGLIDTFA